MVTGYNWPDGGHNMVTTQFELDGFAGPARWESMRGIVAFALHLRNHPAAGLQTLVGGNITLLEFVREDAAGAAT
jgi:hypothetical protein